MFILYKHYDTIEDGGAIGIVIIIVIYGGVLLLNSLLFYNYLVFLHMDGRIIDVFTRVTAKENYFFVPLDNEVSARYLNWIMTKVKLENKKHARNGGIVRTKVFAITSHTVTDAKYKKEITHISVYRKRADGMLIMYRHFMQTGEGTICELEEGNPFTVDEHPLLEKWPANIRRRVPMKRELSPIAGPLHQYDDTPGTFKLSMINDSPSQKPSDSKQDGEGHSRLKLD